ncbi:GPN-loop GTPase QQT1 [Trifolium repens]|nr:GPN-loop GTPase QQT1 [Trifolium repens]
MVFGQVVVGPPGSGKTTYCNGMSQFLNLIGRKVAIVNLDPANDSLPYDCAVNIEDLVKLSDVMIEHSLGPNGGLVYCMDYLEKNIDWLEEKLKPLLKDHYLLFDFPGQVELFFLHSNAKNVIMKLIKKLSLRLMAVHLVDAHLCSDPGKYISALLLSLSTMLHLELPHINVLSKIDLIESYGKLAFNLDFYTDVQDLSYLQNTLDKDPHSAKYRKLTKELCEVIEHYSLVNFTTLDIQDKESVGNLVKLIDKTNGYIFAGIDASAVEFSKIAMGAPDWDYYRYPFFCFACAILTDLSFTLQLISIVKITSFVPYLHDRVALSAYTVVELFFSPRKESDDGMIL